MGRKPTVIGRLRLQRKLKALPDAVKAPIKAALAQGANEIVTMAKNLVPVDSGDLKSSIGWTWGRPPSGSIVLATSQRIGGELAVTVYAGNDEAFYARWVEFGTTKHIAQPYFFPSYRANKRKVKTRINKAVRQAARSVAQS